MLAVLVFAVYKGGGGSQESRITVWGELPAEGMNNILNTIVPSIDKSLSITYVEKSKETLATEFTEALASGIGPDLIITTQDKLVESNAKLLLIPYESVAERDFTETFVEEGELLLAADGFYGFPLLVDPLVMYYNRDLLSSAGESKPITYWDEIFSTSLKLSQRDSAGNITQSTIALGETRNIPNFKEILSLLFLQAGTPVMGFIGNDLRSVLSDNMGLPIAPADAALDFYTQFSNPSKAYYTWNRTLPSAQTHFTSGDSAYYIGLASEYNTIRSKNPNLNFSIASVPQSRVSGRALTYGNLYSVSITRGTRDVPGSLRAALILVSQEAALSLSQAVSLPPARRDLLSVRQTDALWPVLYQAAIQSRGWIDPDPEGSREVFREMIETVTSGRARTQEAINAGSRKLEALIK